MQKVPPKHCALERILAVPIKNKEHLETEQGVIDCSAASSYSN